MTQCPYCYKAQDDEGFPFRAGRYNRSYGMRNYSKCNTCIAAERKAKREANYETEKAQRKLQRLRRKEERQHRKTHALTLQNAEVLKMLNFEAAADALLEYYELKPYDVPRFLEKNQ